MVGIDEAVDFVTFTICVVDKPDSGSWKPALDNVSSILLAPLLPPRSFRFTDDVLGGGVGAELSSKLFFLLVLFSAAFTGAFDSETGVIC